MFHSWGRRLIPESLAPEVQAVYEENVNITTYKHTYIKTYAISIIVRYNYLHGVRSASGKLIENLVKVSLG